MSDHGAVRPVPGRLFLGYMWSAILLSLIESPCPGVAWADWPHDPNNGNVALCAATGIQDLPTIAADGAGGAIVTWEDQRGGNYDIYVQRVSAAGGPPGT